LYRAIGFNVYMLFCFSILSSYIMVIFR